MDHVTAFLMSASGLARATVRAIQNEAMAPRAVGRAADTLVLGHEANPVPAPRLGFGV
jgi:hypothetical protein